MKVQPAKVYSLAERDVWRTLFCNLELCRQTMADPLFASGVHSLGISSETIPDLHQVNRILGRLTGWEGIPVEGLEDNRSFFKGLAERKFPIGNFIRDARDVSYTPAPDIFHDLYGHLPFLADPAYANFCERFGRFASRYQTHERALDLWGRLFWYGVEFPLIESPKGRRIFGGGILSSVGESEYALSPEPVILLFDLHAILNKSYKIDEFQRELFLLKSPSQLYNCLPEYDRLVAAAI